MSEWFNIQFYESEKKKIERVYDDFVCKYVKDNLYRVYVIEKGLNCFAYSQEEIKEKNKNVINILFGLREIFGILY